MGQVIGKRALVVGAGMGGLSAAAAASPYFEEVVLLDRDQLPLDHGQRKGVPQGQHVHALLAGGLRALIQLVPEYETRLENAGAVRLGVANDVQMERPPFGIMPRMDLGFTSWAASRPLVEGTLRQCLRELANVDLRAECSVYALQQDDGAVTGVRFRANGRSDALDADLVIDASGAGDLTLSLLADAGLPSPRASRVTVHVDYATAVFEVPDGGTEAWLGVMTFPDAPKEHMGGLMLPMEGNRWIASVGGRAKLLQDDGPDVFAHRLGQLHTSTIADAVRDARRIGTTERFGFKESRRFHFGELPAFPRGLLPIGDAICRVNPVYGQGMSIAAQSAASLATLLGELSDQRDPLAGLAAPYFASTDQIVDGPWNQAAIPDFVYPDTAGDRPENLELMLQVARHLLAIAVEDPEVYRLATEVGHLLRPRTAYQETPGLLERVFARMGSTA